MKQRILNTKLYPDQIALFYLGQEGFLIKYRDNYLLIDGYLSDYVDRHSAGRAVPWVRNYPAPISGEELDFVDYVFCSHVHSDHADPDTLSTLARINHKAKYIVPAPIVDTIQSYGIAEESLLPARDGEVLALKDFQVTPIASAHEQLNFDKNGDACELGFRFSFGETILYHSGDCCLYDGLLEKLGALDVAMLPVNGRDYYRLSSNIIGNMNAQEAVMLACQTHANLMIPMHFDLYSANGISAAAFAEVHEKWGNRMPYHIFQPGERYIFEK